MKKYEIIKSWHDGLYNRTQVIKESKIYLNKEEAENDRIYFQVDYNELLIMRALDCKEVLK